MISVNGSISDLSAVSGNDLSLKKVFARNGEAGEWVQVWPSNTIRWFRSFTEYIEFDSEIKGSMSNIDVYVGFDTSQVWESYGTTCYGRTVYGTDYTETPVLQFDIDYTTPPPNFFTTYGFYTKLSPFVACDGSGEILVPRSKTNTLGGSTFLYGTSTSITIGSDGIPTLKVSGMAYFPWPGNNVLPHNSGSYVRSVQNNRYTDTMWNGEDYEPGTV